MIDVHARVAPRLLDAGGRLPVGTAPRKLRVCYQQVESTGSDVKLDYVAVAHKPEWTTNRGLRRDVQHHGPIAGTAHARIRYTHHVAHTLRQQLLWDRQTASL